MTCALPPGTVLDVTPLTIERGKVAELARALGDDDAVYRDRLAARAAGFDDTPLPPTASVVIDHFSARGLERILQDDLGLDLSRVLHGEATWEHVAPIAVGEPLVAHRRLAGVRTREGARGGRMTLLTIETELLDERGETVIRRTDTIIERGA